MWKVIRAEPSRENAELQREREDDRGEFCADGAIRDDLICRRAIGAGQAQWGQPKIWSHDAVQDPHHCPHPHVGVRAHGFQIRACGVGQPQEKGRVENGVGYVKKNLLNGLELSEVPHITPAAWYWLDQVAHVRVHGQTHKIPQELFLEEKAKLTPLHPLAYESAIVETVRVTSQFRIKIDGNRYSVPCHSASSRLTLKRFPDRLLVHDQDKLVAEHVRRHDRNQDYELPDHVQPLLLERKKGSGSTTVPALFGALPQG